jgi:hypothetical protein
MASRATQYRKVAPATLERRFAPRHEVQITRAAVRGRSKAPSEAMLCDVSSYGCRLATEARHVPAERVWLKLGGAMPVAATVVWSEQGHLGCRFDQPIARDLMRMLTLGV